MGTIIHKYGPIYGEAVNGTVSGRPNGSIYLPPTNKISLSVTDPYIRVLSATAWAICNASRQFKNYLSDAEAQDLASSIKVEVSDSSDFSTVIAYMYHNAGLFNVTGRNLLLTAPTTMTDGGTYYIRAVLMSSSNQPVAASTAITLTGVNPS